MNRGTGFIHPPIILQRPNLPIKIKAGEEFISPEFEVEDPDGDEIYAAYNVGACKRITDGSFIWKFQTNFPGLYHVEIIFYDIRGNYAITEFQINVDPWWIY